MRAVFLAYHDPVDGIKYAELQTANDPIFFLPAEVQDEIDLTTTVPARRNDYTQLELQSSVVWLSVWGKEACHLLYDGREILIPQSTTSSRYTLLLRDGDHFSNEIGRWSIERDDEQETIQNSMRPPPCRSPPRPNLEYIAPKGAHSSDGDLNLDPQQFDDSSPIDNVPKSGEATEREIDRKPGLANARSSGQVKTLDSPVCSVAANSSEDLRQNPGEIGQSSSSSVETPKKAPDANHEEPGSTPGDCKLKSSIQTSDIAETTTQGGQEFCYTPSDSSHEKHVMGDIGASKTVETRDGKRKQLDVFESGAKRRKFSEKAVQTVQDLDQHLDEENTIVVPRTIPQLETEDKMVDKSSMKCTADSMSPSKGRPEGDSPKKQPKRRGRPRKNAAKTSLLDEGANAEDDSSPPLTGKDRLRRSISTTQSAIFEGSPVVFFASNTDIDHRKNTMKTFHDLGGRKAKSVREANVYCVGDVPLKKTGSLLLAIAQGTDIVTERWIIETNRREGFPSLSKFMPRDRASEQQWGFKLDDAVQRGKNGLAHLLTGTTLYVTQQLDKELGGNRVRDICSIATALGAVHIKTQLPKDSKDLNPSAIVIGCVDDAEAAQVARLGLKMYDKELLTMAVLRGVIDLDGEDFELEIPIKDESSQ